MKAAFIESFDGIDGIKFGDLPMPQIHDHEVLVKVDYAGLNPVDWKIAEGHLKQRMPYEFPIILGWEMAGTIYNIGKNVSQFKEGEPVFAYCRKDITHFGALTEYISLDANNVVRKPKNLSFKEAAAIPLAALTAWQSLFDAAMLKENERVLIHGGGGGVGGYAIQLAKWRKAFVITTASDSKHDYVKKLGADEIIDYTKENFVQKLKNSVDVVFDTIGGDTLKQSFEVLKQNGRLVSLLGQGNGILYVFVHPDGEDLKEIAYLFEQKKLLPPHIEEYPLIKTKEALYKLKNEHVKGKLVVRISL